MCDCLKMSISFWIRVSIVCPFDGGVTQKVRMRIISLAIEFHAMTPMQDVSIKFAANVQGLPQAVEFIDISGGGATTNIILFMRRSQHPAEGGTGLRQAICCMQPFYSNLWYTTMLPPYLNSKFVGVVIVSHRGVQSNLPVWSLNIKRWLSGSVAGLI